MTNDELKQPLIQRNSELEAANKRLSEEIEIRKRTEEKLSKEHDNFLKIFSAAPVGLLLLDNNTVITHANQAVCSMILREPSEVIGLRGGGGLVVCIVLKHPKAVDFLIHAQLVR